MSPRDLERWVEQNRTRLSTQGVAVWFGTTMRVGRHAGPTWVSFLSRTGDAHVTRNADGCCDFDAHRFRDGAVLQHEHRRATTIEELDAFVLMLTSDPPTDRRSTACGPSGDATGEEL